MSDIDVSDPRGLIRESYNIDGISEGECRSIFLDWAISVPVGEDDKAHVRTLLDFYGSDQAGHPMTKVLSDALDPPSRTGRRGGASARRR